VVIGGLAAVVAVYLCIRVRAEDVGCIDTGEEWEHLLEAGAVLQQHERLFHLGDEVLAPVYLDAAECLDVSFHTWVKSDCVMV